MAIRKIKAKKKKVAKNATIMVFNPQEEDQFIHTSSLGFDVLLSETAEGMELGSMIEIAGDSGTGKSTSTFAMACNMARSSGVKVVYLDSEGGIKKSHVRLNKAFELFHPDIADLQDKYGEKIDEFLNHALDGDYNLVVLNANSFDGLDKITEALYKWTENHDEAVVFVIDSLAFISTTSELKDAQSDKAWVSQKAKAFRAWATLNKINLQAHGITTILINHLTMTNIGVYGKKPKKESANGTAALYTPDARILILEGEKILDDNEDIIGHNAKVYTKKNRNNISHRQVIIPMMKGTGPDNARFIENVLIDRNLIKPAAWTTFDFPFLEEPIKVNGKSARLEFIRDHESEFTDYLRQEDLLSLLNLGEKVKDVSSDDELDSDDE